MTINAKFSCQQDLSAFLDLGNKIDQLDKKVVEYGYYDKPHYSGLNYATLAAVHEYGWNNLPMRNFITSSAILFLPELEKLNKKLFKSILSGVSVDTALSEIGIKGAKKIEFVIDRALFSNPIVSSQTTKYRARVGSNNPSNTALFHYGDLKKGTEWKVK